MLTYLAVPLDTTAGEESVSRVGLGALEPRQRTHADFW